MVVGNLLRGSEPVLYLWDMTDGCAINKYFFGEETELQVE